MVVTKAEFRGLDTERILAVRESVANLQQLGRAYRGKAHLIEEAQQPGRSRWKLLRRSKSVPHLHGAAHELIAAGAFHAVHAEIGAADSHGVLGCPRSGGIVFRRYETMTRINGRGYRRSKIDVAQPEHQVAGAKDDAVHLIDRIEAVDAANEFDVAGTPWRIRPHALRVFANGKLRGRIIPGKWKLNHARRHREVVQVRYAPLAFLKRL